MKKILIVDDEPNYLLLLSGTLQDEGYQVAKAEKSRDAISIMENERFDVFITDLAMPDIDGIGLMQIFRKVNPAMPIIIITGVGTIERAVEAMKKGAYDFITKPFELDTLRMATKRAIEFGELHRELNYSSKEAQNKYIFENIISKSKNMLDIFKLINQIADSMATVLIEGESGTGKELIARAIHYQSVRRNKPFLAIDCSALTASLLESELFGHSKGAFTGAIFHRQGLFEEGTGGTIFLDEVGNIPLSMQSKLLRVIQEREIKPVGSNIMKKIDVRIITATNKSLKDLVQKRIFREDLYYRLTIVPISIPPLRERKEDIPFLVAHFIKKYGLKNRKKVKNISREALLKIIQHEWPGNVRELENTIERALLICKGDTIDCQDLFIEGPMTGNTVYVPPKNEKNTLNSAVEESEKAYIISTLQKVNYNRTKAAKMLGVSRRTLYDKIEKYDLKTRHLSI